MNQDRNQKDIDDYKDMKARKSGLKSQGKTFPLINDSDQSEYWQYLTQFKKSSGKSDGLLHFVIEFYRGVRVNKTRMNKELNEITVKIRETLIQMSDDLHDIYESYKEHLDNIEDIKEMVNMAVGSLPNVRTFKLGNKFHVKGGGEEDDEAQLLTDDSKVQEDNAT